MIPSASRRIGSTFNNLAADRENWGDAGLQPGPPGKFKCIRLTVTL